VIVPVRQTTMTLRIRNLQVDVPPEDHDPALAWWAAALGGTPRPVEGPYHHLDGVRATVGVHVQRQDVGPGRLHLDLEADDVDREVARLLTVGAREVGPAGGWEAGTRLLADPAGLPFCVTATGQPQHLAATAGDALRLGVLMIDVPAVLAGGTADFWAAALGGTARPVGPRYPEYTWVHDVSGPGGEVEVAVQALGSGPARLHVDLHCGDAEGRDAAVDRLVAMGAGLHGGAHHWRVLSAPGGHVACVVPDRR
jgi:hypothetical protein